MGEKIYLNWDDARVYWSGGEIDFIWSEVFIIEEVANAIARGGGGGMLPDNEALKWLENKIDPKTVEKFKRIAIRVNGLEKIKEEGKEIVVTADHIRNTLKAFGVKVSAKIKSKTTVSSVKLPEDQ
jgi:hypothetical protein